MVTDPEELLRSIERTREEVANTVNTIAGRLDPKQAAKRGVANVRDSVNEAVDSTRSKLHGGSSWVQPQALSKVTPYARRIPKPAWGAGLAALLAVATVLASRRKRS